MATVIDDTDPHLFWGNGNDPKTWIEDNSGPRGPIEQYYNKTAIHALAFGVRVTDLDSERHASNAKADFMEVKWVGADIAIYGARRDNSHGIYSIIIDSAPPQYFSGLANPNIFQQVLFATSTLAQGDHALRITNEGNRDAPDQPGLIWLDVDFVAVSGVIRNANPGGAQPVPPASSAAAASSAAVPSAVSALSSSSSTSAITSKPAASSSAASSAFPSDSSDRSSAPALASSSSSTSLSMSDGAFPTSSSIALSSADISESSSSALGSSTLTTTFTVTKSGEPSTVPTGTATPGLAGTEGSGSGPNKGLIIGVSIAGTIVLILATVSALWWYRHRKWRREVEEVEEYDADGQEPYARPDSSWARM
ncbi:uncharacterized protein MKK02DRAFT_44791 [Dioszegia hungarica]|uniref:Uncharacterized protein n=1 Tax=Dioszegia hungarica TaxID=4972 RepID=A0AA38LUQ8_9TREE|nr:uncharacterized protein MKK02DRAFT_44791 [Dioszegia hungarica]KAI9636090.1 hypothetical protein MKK02DRAFT_44791 [Dioszegia hungarica]